MKHKMCLFLAVLFVALSGIGYGQSSYPSKPIELVVPWAAGGVADISARITAEFLSREWRQPINVVNKPGGTGVIGTVYVLQSKPDGYTMIMHSVSAGMFNPAMQRKLPYKWNDFTFISRTNVSPLVFVVKGDSPWKTLKELAEAIKRDPTKFSFATGAAGGPTTFCAGMLLKEIGVKFKDVSMVVFDGEALALNSLAGGHASFSAQNLPALIGLVKSGHLRALAVTTPERVWQLPDVPTTAEVGFPKIDLMGWSGVAGPPKLPEEVVKKWADSLQKLSQNEDYRKKMDNAGTIVLWLGPEDFKKWNGEGYKTMLELAEQLGLRK
jgi:tripartite-type tricarboxylate transporter receptor subunit TctC